MKRIALLVLVLAAACNNERPEERKLPGAAAPATPAPTAPGTGSAGSGAAATPGAGGSAAAPGAGGSAAAPGAGGSAAGAPADGKTGFAPFDEALAGTRPWIAADDKAGVVELYAVNDPSGPSGKPPGKLSADLRCGADAAKAVEAVAKQIPERARSGHEPPKCKEDAGVTSCRQPGLAEGDFHLELQYGRSEKTGDAWRVIGVKTTGVGVTAAKEEAKYAELLKQKCK
jgi:hypothetical protein